LTAARSSITIHRSGIIHILISFYGSGRVAAEPLSDEEENNVALKMNTAK